MIETILNIAKMLLAILPFIILCFSSNKVNLAKTDRNKQFIMPVIALIYLIIVMIFMHSINEWLLALIDNIPKWIASLGSFSWMPIVAANVFIQIANFIQSLLVGLNLNFWIFFISNTVIILVYLLVKKFCIAIMAKAVKTDSGLHTKISGIFYEYFPEKNKWCIRENCVQVRGMFKVFYYSAVVISAILMIVSREFYFNGLMRTIFYPVFGIIALGELYFYLDGTTKREYSNDILGEDEEAYKVVNYSLLRKFLRSIFGDKLLTENTSINNALTYDVTTDEIIRELEKSEDPKVGSFATYIDALNKSGFQLDHNYLRSSLDMLNGKSVLFNNPFYNDLIPYAFYPMNRTILSHQKVLIVLGRHSIEDDIKDWIARGIEAVTNIPFLWNVCVLTKEEQDIDIGIVTRSDVLDIELHNANSEFLKNVGFVVIIEPSKLISTAQIGLNMLVKKCKSEEDKNIVYCLCDKNCDGLVDAMSHVLMTSITEVSATKKHLGTSSYMCWEADEEYLHHRLVPNISRYLGLGTELSFAALKNQVSKTKWFGGEAFPVTDIRWIDNQYYYDLTKYAGLPTSQEALDERFITTPNFWSAEVEKNNYLTVEDESNNMFEILRDFSTRTTEQGFINVISSEYLLKDYMADNASIFEADAKAIPFIVADYTRSNRNTILRLALMMSTFPVCFEVLEKELSLMGISVFDLKKQLWYELFNCYSETTKTKDLSDDYRQAVNEAYAKTIEIDGVEFTHDIIKVEESFNLKKGRMETTYAIVDSQFLSMCVSELRSAGYVAEDEKGQRYYLGAELCGQIYQKYLPGQFFTFGGKYYEMLHLTADGQVLVRRAADHINGRPTYRQLREYTICGVKPSDKLGAHMNIEGMNVVKEFADISVITSGYYRMEKYNDFTTAKKISFQGEKIKRTYRNKEILRIELPDFDGKLNDNTRYTITVLFNEIFKTIFAENQAYICAVTDDSFLSEESGNKPLTYSVKGDGYEVDKNSIYIIEDSQLDLGLTVTVERNLQRIFGIIYDYLDWHMETLEASLNPPPDPQPPIVFTDPEEGDEDPKKKGKKGFFAGIGNAFKKIIDKIKGWFKKKPKKGKEPVDEEKPIEEVPTDTPPTGDPEGKKPIEGGEEPEDKKPTEGAEEPEEETPTEGNAEEPEEETPAEGGTEELKPEEMTGPEDKKKKRELEKKAKKEKREQEKKEKEEKKKEKKWGIFDLFKRKKKTQPTDETPLDETPIDETPLDDTPLDETPIDETPNETAGSDMPEKKEAPAEDDISDASDNERDAKFGAFAERRPYHERYYLLYGNESEPAFIDVAGTLKYLAEMGLKRNALKQAREGRKIAEFIEATFKPGKPDARYCDFCGTEIYGVEYETLADGRDRCLSCGRTAIKSGEEFRKIFDDVKRNMEAFFGIRINAGIKVEMVNSKKLHKRLGKAFLPTPKSDGRVLGVAISDRNGYTLLVENGSPRMASMLTMAHELTHIWQYINWNDKAIRKKYGKELYLEIYEGMAKWVEIQYAYLINEPATAKREEIMTSYRDDEYGHGFLRYRANYPFSLGTVITKPTPFMNVETPLDPEYCGAFTVLLPTNGINPGDVEGQRPTPKDPTPPKPIKGPIERNPKALSKYAYNLLSDDEKSIYDNILLAIQNFATETEAPVPLAQAQKIVDYIRRDHPEIFWFRHGAEYYHDTSTQIVSSIKLTYCYTQDEMKKCQEKIDAATKSFLTSVTDTMSDYEATLHIYENIIKLVDYDSIGLDKQTQIDDATVPDDLRSIYGVFVNKKAVCAGYAKALQYLLNKCGIECVYVTSETHAWNVIKLEGDYYHMDVTWGDGTDTKKEKEQISAINYDCFCLTTAEVAHLDSHTPEAIMPLPECTATKCNYHRRQGLYFEKYDFEKVRAIVCEYAKANKLDVSFKFASSEVLNEAKKQLVDNHKFNEAIQFASLKSNVKLDRSQYRYSAREERLTMSFYMKRM